MRSDPKRILILAGWCAFAPLAIEAARTASLDLRWSAAAAVWAVAYALRELRRFQSGPLALWSCAAQGVAAVVVAVTGPREAHHAALIAVTAAELADLLPIRLAFPASAAISVAALAALLVQGRLHASHLAAIAALPLFALAAANFQRREQEARVALCDAHARLAATLARLGETSRQNERLRISRDLHDGVGHHLVALVFLADQALLAAPPDLQLLLGPLAHHARAAMKEARLAAVGLRQSRSDLPRALIELGEGLQVLRLHVAGDVSLRVSGEVGEVAFRCAQEIVTNAMKHGRAANVWIAVNRSGNELEMQARDDGEAMEALAGGDLRAMRERLRDLGGTVEARRRDPGFEVSVRIPLEGAA